MNNNKTLATSNINLDILVSARLKIQEAIELLSYETEHASATEAMILNMVLKQITPVINDLKVVHSVICADRLPQV